MPNFVMGADTRLIRQELQKLKPGDILPYGELSKVVGYEVSGATGAFQSARNSLRRDDMVFGIIRGVGVKRLTDTEIVDHGSGRISRARKQSRLVVRESSAINDFSGMPFGDQIRQNANLTTASMVERATNRKARNAIESAVKTAATELPFKDAVKAIGESIKS